MISRVKKITNLHYKNWEIDVEVSLPGKVNALIGRVTGFLHCSCVTAQSVNHSLQSDPVCLAVAYIVVLIELRATSTFYVLSPYIIDGRMSHREEFLEKRLCVI